MTLLWNIQKTPASLGFKQFLVLFFVFSVGQYDHYSLSFFNQTPKSYFLFNPGNIDIIISDKANIFSFVKEG